MKHTKQGRLFTQIVLETFKLSGIFTSEGGEIAKTFGLTSARWKIISAIARSKTPPTVSQIGQSMGLSRQAVQRLVDAMYKDYFLDFKNNPNHKRAKLVSLTIKGKETYSQLIEKQKPWANEYSSEISEKDLEITIATLRKISSKKILAT